MPEIVPVELTLPSGTWVTLYQRDWDDADDDSLAFLGGDDAVYAFPSAEALTSYAGGNDDHHLGASPLWPAVKRRFRDEFTPSAENSYDLKRSTERGQDMLAELLVYFRMEVPEGDWSMHPLQRALPQEPVPRSRVRRWRPTSCRREEPRCGTGRSARSTPELAPRRPQRFPHS